MSPVPSCSTGPHPSRALGCLPGVVLHEFDHVEIGTVLQPANDVPR